MANQWYPKASNHFGAAQIDLLSDDIKWAAVSAGYTFSTSHEFVSDLGANIVGRSANLTSKTLGTIAAGIFDAADTQFSALAGSAVTQLVMFKDTGVDATSVLLLQVNGTDYAGITFTPSGANAQLAFPSGGIAQL